MRTYLRQQTRTLIQRLERPGTLLQIIVGPRQVGKTTAIHQTLTALKKRGVTTILASADAVAAPPAKWISAQWKIASKAAKSGEPVVLAFDELQKIPGWSELIKAHIDRGAQLPPKRRPRVILSGSSALLIERGLTESLAGRFELIRFPHWSFQEMHTAFALSLREYLATGGYPKIREFHGEPARFREYVRDSIIEPVLNKDILLLHPVNKPALLRRLFEFSCYHPAEVVSLQKMLGQLTDKGNVTTIADYLHLLSKAFLIAPIQKYSQEILRIRASSPKLIVMAQALVSSVQNAQAKTIAGSPELLGRLTENAVGAALVRMAAQNGGEVFYWRERDLEVDYILKLSGKVLAIEVKSGRAKETHSGLSAFLARNKEATGIIISNTRGAKSQKSLSLEDFFQAPERVMGKT
ncbi:MAG: ATP-binding protein [Elusimicrobiota bacterium]|nr:ATP-binding protein [Elusimicrobiota bacterium]